MTRLTFYVGLGENPTDGDLVRSGEQYLASVYGGYTVSFGRGGWTNPENGQLVTEPSAVFTVLKDSENGEPLDAEHVARWLSACFGQLEVWYSVEAVTVLKYCAKS